MLNHDVYTHIQAIVLNTYTYINIHTYTTSDNQLIKHVCLRIPLAENRSIKVVNFFPLKESNK